MSDIIDEVNFDFQNGQTIMRGKRITRLLSRAFDLRAENEDLKQKLIRQSELCFWTPDAGYDYIAYDSQCGQSWVFEDGGPTENNMRYCPFCGKLLTQVESEQSEEK